MLRPRLTSLVAAIALLVLFTTPAFATGETGGASGDYAEGGAADGGRSGALAYGTPPPVQPVARLFRVTPGAITEGRTPRIRVRIDHPAARSVAARIVLVAAGGRVGGRIDLGRVRTGRALRVRWPSRVKLAAGTYTVRLHAVDPDGQVLARAARTTGKARLIVRRRPRPETPQPAPRPEPTPPAPPAPPAASGDGVFPVTGPFTFGGEDSRFGAGRGGRTHQGQDISAAAGLPVVAPVAGTIAFADFQAGGAGHYVVLTAEDGRTMFFAHLQDRSVAVRVGQRVPAGGLLGRVGSTGASSGPHLHFEIWLGGWRHQGGRPIDPLPTLRAWAS